MKIFSLLFNCMSTVYHQKEFLSWQVQRQRIECVKTLNPFYVKQLCDNVSKYSRLGRTIDISPVLHTSIKTSQSKDSHFYILLV